ncbi:pectinesterase family protein [Treponema sp.]|uniref:pectinesterase family protein n=1 Tax=Treponema sp. TaxID=166 RepID=UPI003F024DB3
MLELNVNNKSPAAIAAALKKIKEMISTGTVAKDTPVHLVLEPGFYRETIRYNLSNPLLIESAPGTKAENCVILADNCEAYNKGQQNRAVFSIGPNATNISLKNFTISNTHIKTSEEPIAASDSAEALVWNNSSGTLFCEGMKIEGKQNTLFLKGFSWFLNSTVSGDVDFIYGEPDTCLFENCAVEVISDNRGDFNGFAVNSHAVAEKNGFVFTGCRFFGEKRKKTSVFACRTDGTAESAKDWNSIAFINCIFSDIFAPELLWDDDMNLEVYPRGNAKYGIREYNSKTVSKNGKLQDSDTSRRNIKSYTLTEDDYFNGYASRYLILHDTPFSELLSKE